MEFSDDERLGLQRLMRWRRDVRHFRTDPVPEALLDTLKEAMSLAPSVGNARPWRVLQVENADLRQAVQALHDQANAQALAAQPTTGTLPAAEAAWSGGRPTAAGRIHRNGTSCRPRSGPAQHAAGTGTEHGHGHSKSESGSPCTRVGRGHAVDSRPTGDGGTVPDASHLALQPVSLHWLATVP